MHGATSIRLQAIAGAACAAGHWAERRHIARPGATPKRLAAAVLEVGALALAHAVRLDVVVLARHCCVAAHAHASIIRGTIATVVSSCVKLERAVLQITPWWVVRDAALPIVRGCCITEAERKRCI